eukprot:CAMPEP_0114644022 /NCGR_PEP_ID=MMETSP0191-20121206/3732_1 /TAXON_ID=126664 /ORGANISM="Sorites sp." /LENGTH=224 /DNA_ID=CAMNT_0001856429 /DNA_START=11 /DNA_END=685 /DNA_ORIENTATION=-
MSVEADVEKQGSPVKAGTEADAPRRCGSCCSRRCFLLFLLLSFGVLVGAATAALWPRDPTWKLTNLDVLDESALMFFVMAFGNNNIKNDTKLPDILFHAGASVENPNLLGGTVRSGAFQVLYQNQLLGSGHSEPAAVPALGSGDVQADVQLKLNPTLFKQLSEDVLQHELHATVKVKGTAAVKSIFGLQLECRMDCDIQARVTEIFGESKHAVVENKNCTYKYF